LQAQNSAGNLKGKIYYDLGHNKSKAAASLIVYLIPNITENSRIIRESSGYETHCNEPLLKTAKNYKVAITDKDGYYFFTNTPAGKYLLKICTYYGGFYSFTIRSNFTGTYNLPDFEADPPIRSM
jgi:hypothetical protein